MKNPVFKYEFLWLFIYPWLNKAKTFSKPHLDQLQQSHDPVVEPDALPHLVDHLNRNRVLRSRIKGRENYSSKLTSSLVFTLPRFLLGVGVLGCLAQPGLRIERSPTDIQSAQTNQPDDRPTKKVRQEKQGSPLHIGAVRNYLAFCRAENQVHAHRVRLVGQVELLTQRELDEKYNG